MCSAITGQHETTVLGTLAPGELDQQKVARCNSELFNKPDTGQGRTSGNRFGVLRFEGIDMYGQTDFDVVDGRSHGSCPRYSCNLGPATHRHCFPKMLQLKQRHKPMIFDVFNF
jgi:hypothetical protein